MYGGSTGIVLGGQPAILHFRSEADSLILSSFTAAIAFRLQAACKQANPPGPTDLS